MTKKNIIYPFLALMTIGSVSGAESSVLINHSININESEEEWVLVKEEKGIKVYFTEFLEKDGVTLLKIKFENTLDQDVKMYWTLQKGDKYIFENVELIVSKKNIYQVDYTTMMVPLSKDDLLKDFIIIFHKN
jgi:uncharacterized protein YkuJ